MLYLIRVYFSEKRDEHPPDISLEAATRGDAKTLALDYVRQANKVPNNVTLTAKVLGSKPVPAPHVGETYRPATPICVVKRTAA